MDSHASDPGSNLTSSTNCLIFTEIFKAKSVSSLDNSSYENADEIIDLNLPINKGYKEFDSVIDFGTSEHIFNVSQCLKNISSLCKINGQIIHCLPSNNSCGHGFWQFSPELFFQLYQRKGDIWSSIHQSHVQWTRE